MDIASLALQAQAGDLVAFDRIITLIIEPMTGRIARLYRLAGPDFREQVFWGAAELAWEKIKCFDPAKGSFTNWFCLLIKQVAKKLMHEYKASPAVSIDELQGKGIEPAVAGPAVHFQSAELCRRVQAAIDELPERYRRPFNLHFQEGYSLDETGKLIGKSKNAAAHRVECARRLLARRLGLGWESCWFGADWVEDDDEESGAVAA